MSTDLLSCLQAQKWHTLRGLARANNLPFDSNLTAAQAAKHLHANLGQDNFFPTLWPALSSEAQAVCPGWSRQRHGHNGSGQIVWQGVETEAQALEI